MPPERGNGAVLRLQNGVPGGEVRDPQLQLRGVELPAALTFGGHGHTGGGSSGGHQWWWEERDGRGRRPTPMVSVRQRPYHPQRASNWSNSASRLHTKWTSIPQGIDGCRGARQWWQARASSSSLWGPASASVCGRPPRSFAVPWIWVTLGCDLRLEGGRGRGVGRQARRGTAKYIPEEGALAGWCCS